MTTDEVQYLDWQWVEENPQTALCLMLELHRENAALRALLKEAADYLDPTDAPCRREGPLVARILAKLQEGQL